MYVLDAIKVGPVTVMAFLILQVPSRRAWPTFPKSNYRQPQPAATARPPQQDAKPRPWVKHYTCAHCGKSTHHSASWQKYDHSVAVTCGLCKKLRKEAPASNKAMAAVSAEKAHDMQKVLRQQTATFMAAMRKQLQGPAQVPVREAAFTGMREMEGNGFELGMGMTAMDIETKNNAILEAGSKATINEEVLTRQAKVQAQADAAGEKRTVGAWKATEKQSTPDISTPARQSLSRQSMLSNTVFNWITGFEACLFVLSFLSHVHKATYQMVTYVHGLFTENTCNRVLWIWGCKPQSNATP